MNKILQSNVDFVQKFDAKLAFAIQEASSDVVLVQHTNTSLSEEYDLEYSDKLVAQDLISSSVKALKSQLEKPKRVLIQRLMRSNIQPKLLPKQIYASIIDSDNVELIQHFESLYPENIPEDRINPSLDLIPPNLLLIGSLSLLTINDLLTSCPSIESVLLVETSINQLVSTLNIIKFENVVSLFKAKNIKFNLIFDPALADNSASLNAILRHYANLNPLALHSLSIFRSPVYESSYELIYSWLQSPDGFGELVKGYLGNETDEINQSLHTIAAALSESGNQVLIDKSIDPHELGAILTASGPSLDQYLDLIKSYHQKVPIVCAGSSFSSVLKAGINPSAVVLLEMSSSVYYDLLDLIAEGFDLSQIYAFVSATVDPRIHSLFKGTIIFHRPLSSSACLFDDSYSSQLPQAGPQAVNAALEVLVHLGYRNLFLAGCDFGGPSISILRSKNAMGKSSRKFDIPVMGGYGRTIMTSNELSVTRQLFENIARVFEVKLNVFGEGSKIEGANHIKQGSEYAVMDNYRFWEKNFFDSFFNGKSKRFVDPGCVKQISLNVRNFVDDLESSILSACAEQDLAGLKVLVSDLLIWSDESIPKERRISQRIIRYPLFFIGQSIVDFHFIACSEAEISQHWANLQHDLNLLLKLLRYWCDCLDSLCMTASIETWPSSWLKRSILNS